MGSVNPFGERPIAQWHTVNGHEIWLDSGQFVVLAIVDFIDSYGKVFLPSTHIHKSQ